MEACTAPAKDPISGTKPHIRWLMTTCIPTPGDLIPASDLRGNAHSCAHSHSFIHAIKDKNKSLKMCFALKFQCLHLLGMGHIKLVAPVPREEEWEERVTVWLCLWLQPGRPGGVIQKREIG